MQKENGNLIVLVNPNRKITQLELSECVLIENQIRVLRKTLGEKCSDLRERITDGALIEEGPLEGFAEQIAGIKRAKK